MFEKLKTKKSFILTNIYLVDPATNREGDYEILVEDGIIKNVDLRGKILASSFANTKPEVLDGKGLLCVPGLVDIHVHLREPGFEYKETIETGTMAAAAGGVTSVLCMANTNPVNDNPYVTQYILSQAKTYGKVKVYPVGALSKGLKGESLAEIGKMKEVGIQAVSDDGMTVMNSYLMRKALDYCKAFNLPIISHAEDTNLVGSGVMNEGLQSNLLGLRGIPSEAEEIIVARDIALARLTQGKVHFAHISCWQSLEHIKKAKEENLKITAEVTPHHLVFTDEDVSSYDSNFKMAPPLRTKKDIESLKNAIKVGLIDCIASDHAPHAPRDKNVVFENAANGVVGLETNWSVGLSLVREGVCSLSKLVELMSLNPAKIMGISAGSLKEGSPADFMLSDINAERILREEDLHSKSKNSPFIGKKLYGKVVATFVDGDLRWSLDSF
jgi:dihydroorotase